MTLWPKYDNIAISPYDYMVSKVANMFLETAKKLAKELSPFDLPAINESKNGLIAYFPLYFSEFPLYIRKWWPLHKNALNLMKCF